VRPCFDEVLIGITDQISRCNQYICSAGQPRAAPTGIYPFLKNKTWQKKVTFFLSLRPNGRHLEGLRTHIHGLNPFPLRRNPNYPQVSILMAFSIQANNGHLWEDRCLCWMFSFTMPTASPTVKREAINRRYRAAQGEASYGGASLYVLPRGNLRAAQMGVFT